MRSAVFLFVFASVFCAFEPAAAQEGSPSSPREQLKQYVADLQKNPTDEALRTKIIQLALTLDPKPAVPDDASVDAAKAKTIFASASSPDDMKAAAATFAQASQLAPWVPEYYYNQGLALEKAKQYDDAIRALSLYLLAAPNAADVADVRGKIEGIKYEKEKAISAVQTEFENRAKKFVGRWGDETGSFIVELRLDSVKHENGRYLATYIAIPPSSGTFPCDGCSATVAYDALWQPKNNLYDYDDPSQDIIHFGIVMDIQISLGPLREFVDDYRLKLSPDGGKLLGAKMETYKQGRTPYDVRNNDGRTITTNVTLYRQ